MRLTNLLCPRCGAFMASDDGINFTCNSLKHEPYETTVQEQLFDMIDLYMQEKQRKEDEENDMA